MKLSELQLEGFKCFQNRVVIPIKTISVLIGENDSGKSSILRAIELLLTKQNPSQDEYFSLNDVSLEEFQIQAKFEKTHKDADNTLKPYLINNTLTIKKNYKKQESFKTFIQKLVFENENLENFQNLNADKTKQLLEELSINDLPNQDARRKAIKDYIDKNYDLISKITKEVEINFSDIQNFLPIYQYYGSHIYGNPQSLIKRTLDSIYSSYFYDESGTLKLSKLRGLKEKVFKNLNKEIEDNLLAKIKLYNPNIFKIQGRLDIDFSRGLDFQGLELDEGTGFKLIDQKGEGSKKRLFLSILEWDKEVQFDLRKSRAIFRAYDEPDANLHYHAQRTMFNAITDVSNNQNSNIQSLIATHSIAMIDKAPDISIIHVVQNAGLSTVDYLHADDNQEIISFLNQISIVGGIKNSSIFYEKCFLLVEGESEESAIPKIYNKLFNRTLAESGVVLINLKSNGAWYNFLKLLHKNKKNITVMLLDSDTQNPNCGANVTSDKLTEIGFDQNFLQSNVFFAGTQEFEDIFPDSAIRNVFNHLYERPKGKWNCAHIRDIRNNYPKLSEGFREASKTHISHHRKIYKKPEFASKLADIITVRELRRIQVLQDLFRKIHNIIE